MTTEQIPTFAGWIPRKHAALRMGPPRWNGETMISDIGLHGTERLVEIGLIERFILTAVDGRRGIAEIAEFLAEQGIDLPEQRVMGVLNKFAFFGAVERPFTIGSGVQDIDRLAARGPSLREDQFARGPHARGLPALWRLMGWMAGGIAVAITCIVGLAALGLLIHTVPAAGAALAAASGVQWLVALPIALGWTLLVTFLHENSHAAVFHSSGGGTPFLALTRFGIILMPNTHMPGFSLLSTAAKVRVIAIGPAVSMICSLVPVAIFAQFDQPLVRMIAAVCLCLDALVICLGISFFPNTDASRLLEVCVGVDQIQMVAFRALMRKSSVPASLPLRSKLAIRIYPVLLLATSAMWLAVVLWACQLMTN